MGGNLYLTMMMAFTLCMLTEGSQERLNPRDPALNPAKDAYLKTFDVNPRMRHVDMDVRWAFKDTESNTYKLVFWLSNRRKACDVKVQDQAGVMTVTQDDCSSIYAGR